MQKLLFSKKALRVALLTQWSSIGTAHRRSGLLADAADASTSDPMANLPPLLHLVLLLPPPPPLLMLELTTDGTVTRTSYLLYLLVRWFAID